MQLAGVGWSENPFRFTPTNYIVLENLISFKFCIDLPPMAKKVRHFDILNDFSFFYFLFFLEKVFFMVEEASSVNSLIWA